MSLLPHEARKILFSFTGLTGSAFKWGTRQHGTLNFLLLLFAFCLLPFSFLLLPFAFLLSPSSQ